MKLIKNYLIGISTFIILVLLLLFIVSIVFAYTKIEDRFIYSGIFLSMSISAFFSSFILCKMFNNRVVINMICVLILFIISSILNGGVSITNTLGIYLAICSLSGIVGGILGVNV